MPAPEVERKIKVEVVVVPPMSSGVVADVPNVAVVPERVGIVIAPEPNVTGLLVVVFIPSVDKSVKSIIAFGLVRVILPPIVCAAVNVFAPSVAIEALASGNVKVRKAVGPVTAKIPSPVSIQGCPGLGVTARVTCTIEKVTPTSKRALKNKLNLKLENNFFIISYSIVFSAVVPF